MKKLLGSFAILALATPLAAQAADLPVAPAYKAPVIAPVVFSWTGCYVGGNVGGKWEAHRDGSVTIPGVAGLATSTFTFGDGSSSNNGSFVGGGQVGCNYQMGSIVWGIEGDFDWNHLTDGAAVGTTAVPFNFVPGDSFSWVSRWQASLRGRVGYAWDRTLLYVTGGVAYQRELYCELGDVYVRVRYRIGGDVPGPHRCRQPDAHRRDRRRRVRICLHQQPELRRGRPLHLVRQPDLQHRYGGRRACRWRRLLHLADRGQPEDQHGGSPGQAELEVRPLVISYL